MLSLSTDIKDILTIPPSIIYYLEITRREPRIMPAPAAVGSVVLYLGEVSSRVIRSNRSRPVTGAAAAA